MNAESGTTVTPELPELPAETFDADEADPGEVAEIRAEQAQRGEGKYGSTEVGSGSSSSAARSGAEEDEEETPTETMTFELRDNNDEPIAREPYEVRLPDGSTRSGRTGEDGSVQIDGVEEGEAEVSFPRLQDGEWDQG